MISVSYKLNVCILFILIIDRRILKKFQAVLKQLFDLSQFPMFTPKKLIISFTFKTLFVLPEVAATFGKKKTTAYG